MILKMDGRQAGLRSGCLKKGGAGNPLRTMRLFRYTKNLPLNIPRNYG